MRFLAQHRRIRLCMDALNKTRAESCYLCKRRLLGSGNVSCTAERIALTRASFLSISSQDGSQKGQSYINNKSRPVLRQSRRAHRMFSIKDVKGTHCRLPTVQCSRMQEQEMKVALGEHAEDRMILLHISKNNQNTGTKHLGSMQTFTQSPMTWASSSGPNSALPTTSSFEIKGVQWHSKNQLTTCVYHLKTKKL